MPFVTVILFFVSLSLVVFFLLVCFIDYVPLVGEIMWYLSLTAWLISLSIMLSSSIHAVAKGISSFYAAERKKELIPFAMAWMELESIILSEISQAVRDKYHMISPLTGT